MKFKRILSAITAAAMSISVMGFSAAAENSTVYSNGFADDSVLTGEILKQGYKSNNVILKYNTDENRTGSESGSVYFAPVYNKYSSFYSTDIDLSKINGLKNGQAYKFSIWLYARRVNKAGNTVIYADGSTEVSEADATLTLSAAVANSYDSNITATQVTENPTDYYRVNNLGSNYTTLTSSASPEQGEWKEFTYEFLYTPQMKFIRMIYSNLLREYENGKKVENYDMYYLDDMSFEEIPNEEYFTNDRFKPLASEYGAGVDQYVYNGQNPYVAKYTNKDITLNSAFAKFDVSTTKRVIKKGETAPLIARIIENGDVGNKVSDVVFKDVDLANITAVSEDTGIASYDAATGTISANAVGSTLITFTESTTGASQTLLVTVHPGNDDEFEVSAEKDSTNGWFSKIKHPVDTDTYAMMFTASNNSKMKLTSEVNAKKPSVISIRKYHTGRRGLSENAGEKAVEKGTASLYMIQPTTVTMGGVAFTVQQRADRAYESFVVGGYSIFQDPLAGWNNFDICIDYPTTNNAADGYMKFTYYVNGKLLKTEEKQLTGNTIDFITQNSDMMDINIVSLAEELKISSVNPSDGKLSTLDDIDVNFTVPVKLEDGAFTLTDSESNALEINPVLSADKKTASVKPIGGLKPNKEYTLSADRTKISGDIAGDEFKGAQTEYTFTTDATEVADVIGKGYILVNSQTDMIESGNYTINQDMVKEDNVLHGTTYTDTKQYVLASMTADETFADSKYMPERYIVEFDAKGTAVPDGEKTVSSTEPFRFDTYGADENGNAGIISMTGTGSFSSGGMGLSYTSKGESFNTGRELTSNGADWIIENKDWYHFRLVYDINKTNELGDTEVTAYIYGTDGSEYKMGPVYAAMATRESGTDAFGSMKFINKVDITDAFTVSGAGIAKYENQKNDIYIKNFNMYAVQKDADYAEDMEIKNVIVSDVESGDVVTSGAGLSGKEISVACTLANNNLADNQQYKVIAVVKDKSTNKLAAVGIAGGTAPKGMETNAIANVDMTKYTTGSYTLEIYVWSGIDTLNPLTEVSTPFGR